MPRVLVEEAAIDRRITALGRQISADYYDKNPVLVGVLKGSVPFMGGLHKSVFIPCQFDYIEAYSYYGERVSSGVVQIHKDIRTFVENRHVILVDDVLDTGETLNFLANFLRQKNPASLELAVLVKKKVDPPAEIQPKYIGFCVENEFLVGFGLDHREQYRNLPYIAALDADDHA